MCECFMDAGRGHKTFKSQKRPTQKTAWASDLPLLLLHASPTELTLYIWTRWVLQRHNWRTLRWGILSFYRKQYGAYSSSERKTLLQPSHLLAVKPTPKKGMGIEQSGPCILGILSKSLLWCTRPVMDCFLQQTVPLPHTFLAKLDFSYEYATPLDTLINLSEIGTKSVLFASCSISLRILSTRL